ncbi:MAG: histidine ammonia-lyase, partial [Chloroflexi bacterium]|nr:histidine ammonia-lyase [Chloroflexota bacterium]
ELLAAAQAIDFRRRELDPDASLGRGTAAAYRLIREHIPFFPEDVALAPYMAKAAELVAQGTLREAVMAAMEA